MPSAKVLDEPMPGDDALSRRDEANTSMTCPAWSIAR
jgi:hypothetical protein